MHRRDFLVLLPDLEDGPKRYRWELPVAWLTEALSGTDAAPQGEIGSLEVEAMKNGREVVVRGAARAKVLLPCSRTLDPVEVLLAPDVFLMLSPAEGQHHAGKRRAPKAAPRGRDAQNASSKESRPAAGKRASARKPPEDDSELDDQDAARDVFRGEEIVLDAFVREFLLLDLPMVVTRSDLPSVGEPAIGAASKNTPAESVIDPRLQPLAELASRMRKSKE